MASTNIKDSKVENSTIVMDSLPRIDVLKAHAYDLIAQLEAIKNRLVQVNQEIIRLANEEKEASTKQGAKVPKQPVQ